MMRPVLMGLLLATTAFVLTAAPASAAPGCTTPQIPPPQECVGAPGDPAKCREPDLHRDECHNPCPDPEECCDPVSGECYVYTCDDEAYRDFPQCRGGPGAPGCSSESMLPVIPGVNYGSECRGGPGGPGAGWGPGGEGGSGCSSANGIIVVVPPNRCEGGPGGPGGPNGPPQARGGAGCEGSIVIDLGGCFGGQGQPPGPPCRGGLFLGVNCGLGGRTFCGGATGSVVPSSGRECTVIPGREPDWA